MAWGMHHQTRLSGRARFDFVTKLAFHRRQILAALEDEPARSLATVFLDLTAGNCNHDCTFCDGDLYPLAPAGFSTERLLALADELVTLGADSVIFVGEKSEPLLHPGFARLSRKLIDLRLRLGLYTNGSVLTDEIVDLAPAFDFVRVSLDAGRASTYGRIHRPTTVEGDVEAHERAFKRALAFVRHTARAGAREVGASFTMVPENVEEIHTAASLVKSLGAAYLEVKPRFGPDYTFDAASFSCLRSVLLDQLATCEALHDSTFHVILNRQLEELLTDRATPNRLLRTPCPRPCLTSRLRLVVNPRGSFVCPVFRGRLDKSIGDARTTSLHAIWFGPRRRALMHAECDRRCVYHQQNDALLAMRAGKRDLPPHAAAQVQRGFL